MAESEEAQYKQDFMRRTAEARVARGWKQWQAAEALGIPQDQYKQYETRGMMPHRLLARFCLVCRVELEWLLTGHGTKALQPLKIAEAPEAPVTAAKPKPQRRRAKRVA